MEIKEIYKIKINNLILRKINITILILLDNYSIAGPIRVVNSMVMQIHDCNMSKNNTPVKATNQILV